MKKIVWAIIVVVAVVGAVVAATLFSSTEKQATQTKPSDLDSLASIELQTFDGRMVTLPEYKGKPLIVNLWAVWCPFCKQELPDFATLQQEFSNIVAIAIDRGENPSDVRSYVDGLGITEKMVYLLDSKDDFYKSIGGFSMPETIFIDRNGMIVFHKRGPLTLDEMRSAVNQYLK